MEPLLLGIDIGTSACKVALFTPDGAVRCHASRAYPVLHPHPGWAEQNPADWWNAVCGALKELVETHNIDPTRIAGIGVDGQSGSAIPVDGGGQVLHNTPIWLDTRSVGLCEDMNARLGEDRIFEVSGNPLKPAYSLPKVLWYKQARPNVYENTRYFLQSNAYIVWRFTGEVSQDICQGYGYQFFHMRKGVYDRDLCREMGLAPAMFPDIVPCHHIVGRVSRQAAAECGLAPGIPVVAGGLDAACGALGSGVLAEGQTQEQGGQAGGMSICTSEYKADPRLILGYHVVPGRWLLQAGSVGGGGTVRWFEQELGAADRLAAEQNGTNAFYEMDREAAAVPPGSGGVVFLPYMAGERCPIWDANAKGVYYGLDYAKTRAHLIRATMEGAALSLRHNFMVAAGAGAVIKEIRAMGGAANSRLWTQIKADATGYTFQVPGSDTATTWGAALLAAVAVGLYPDFERAVEASISIQREHTPNPEAKPAYDKAFTTYLELYERLKPLMQRSSP